MDFYKSLFGSSTKRRIHIRDTFWGSEQEIQSEDRDSLIREITEDEMKGVVFNMKSNTAPGPNGFGVTFFRNFLDMIKGDIMDMVRDFQIGSLDLKRLNYGVITLLSKVKESINIKQYRPICLLNVDYKMFTKMMSDRISPLANHLIKQQQTALIKGKNILEGFVILH